ncbi:MAG: hypothetical protein HQL63_06795 [Magnetococcales bacterium]|nr:hypothetical protein [Magnetococcales bacterium]
MEPCPWCGAGQENLRTKYCYGNPANDDPAASMWHATVVCRGCRAQGPACQDELRAHAAEKATALWNERQGRRPEKSA